VQSRARQWTAGSLRERLRGFTPRGLLRLAFVAVPALAAATALVWILETRFDVLNASPVYLLAVVVTALVSGTVGALLAAVSGILIYDYLFTHPFQTFAISDPAVWLNLILLLFVGLVVGQLTALERARAVTAETREREARELFLVSRALATRSSTTAVLSEIGEVLRREAGLRAVWFALGPDDASERVVAVAGDAGAGPVPAPGSLQWQLRRMPGEEPARWVRIHNPASGRGRDAIERGDSETYRVRIEAASRSLGTVWATRDRRRGNPDRSATRLLSTAADQVGQALAADQLAAEAGAAEVARQSDALKSALLQSVSHDLRTPLATIRTAAGTLRPDSDLDAEGRTASAAAIEREVERLDRLVANLLDLGRIEAGELRADLDVFELDDLAGRTIDRLGPRLAGHSVHVDVGPLPVLVDPVFLDEALTNLLDNALKFTSAASKIEIEAEAVGADWVRLVVEDDGPGVADGTFDALFERFHRRPAADGRPRPGTGIGLAVVRGLVEAMGGRVRARASSLGGLAVEMDLPHARLPAELAATR
jgi:two-component system, OmpR family, sensor histidine kinase KdpD